MVIDCWNSTQVSGTISYRIAYKLRRLKPEIRTWAKVTSKKEEEYVNEILQEIDLLDRKEEISVLSPADWEKKNVLKTDLANRLQMEATPWKQKSRKKWIKDGDKNSKYFHLLASHRRRVNFVDEPIIGDNCIKGNGP